MEDFKDPVQRINFDLDLLYQQQLEFQKISHEPESPVELIQSSYQPKSFADLAFGYLSPSNLFRKLFISVVFNPWFERFILLVIFLNCVVITIDHAVEVTEFSYISEEISQVIFTAEVVLRLVAMGVVRRPYSYFRDAWNVLDFIIVVLGWLMVSTSSVSIIRILRVLKPLRTINYLQELKVIVSSIINSIPMLIDTLLIYLMLILIFSIAGTQIYVGAFRYRCYSSEHQPTSQLCTLDLACEEFELGCGNSGCPSGQYCKESPTNPNMGVTGFDNILQSLLTVFGCITLEGWSDVMYMGRDVLDIDYINDLYFIVVVIFGAFFIVNLVVSILYLKFRESAKESKAFKQSRLSNADKPNEEFGSQSEKKIVALLRRVQEPFYKLAKSSYFKWGIVGMIILNTAIMATEYHGMHEEHKYFIELSNLVFTIVCSTEVGVKVIGLGLKKYLKDKMNLFDAALAMIGLVEIIFVSGDSGLGGLVVLRAFRILRVFKLARGWGSFRLLLRKVIISLPSIGYLGLLCMLWMFIYSLLGMEVFKGTLKDDEGNIPRANFETFYWSMITVFQILTGENWNEVMYYAINSTGWLASFYFVTLITVGNYILLNLFLAILLQKFEEEDTDPKFSLTRKTKVLRRISESGTGYQPLDRKNLKNIRLEGKSLFVFSENSRVRNFLKDVMTHPYFDSAIYGVIGLSSVLLLLDEPYQESYHKAVIELCHKLVLVIFALESLIKVIVFGFLLGKNSYLRNPWNILDFLIVLISVADWVISVSLDSNINLSFIRAFRALRALRPLRVISRNERMKMVVNCVLKAMPLVFNVMLISLLFYLIFGILGVIFFKGKFHYCTDELVKTKENCFGEYQVNGVALEREWKNQNSNFDNVFNSILVLFEISTLEMWPDYMYSAVDSVSSEEAPERDYNPAAALYFVAFIFITGLFIMNLYVGAVIKKFNEVKEEMEGSILLTKKQKTWIKVQKLLLKCSPQVNYIRPQNPFRGALFNFVLDYKFEYLVLTVIGVNILFLSLQHHNMDQDLENILEVWNYVFIGLYTLEFLLKATGLNFKFYFANNWNKFDFSILILSYLSILFSDLFFNATVLRALRISRLFRMIRIFRGFRDAFNTMLLSLPFLVNIGALILLLYFIYSVAGMSLFGELPRGEFINKHANFETFYNSMITLFRASTGESWNGLMHDCSGYGCSGNDCGNPTIAVLFWVSFSVIGSFVLLNIFIAVILENFTDINQEKDSQLDLSKGDLKKYREAWSAFAPYGELYIETQKLPQFLEVLEAPLGFKGQNLSRGQLIRIIDLLGVKDHQGYVHFAEILWILADSVSGGGMQHNHSDTQKNIQRTFTRKFKTQPPTETTNENRASLSLAAMLIVNRWRKRVKARRKALS